MKKLNEAETNLDEKGLEIEALIAEKAKLERVRKNLH